MRGVRGGGRGSCSMYNTENLKNHFGSQDKKKIYYYFLYLFNFFWPPLYVHVHNLKRTQTEKENKKSSSNNQFLPCAVARDNAPPHTLFYIYMLYIAIIIPFFFCKPYSTPTLFYFYFYFNFLRAKTACSHS